MVNPHALYSSVERDEHIYGKPFVSKFKILYYHSRWLQDWTTHFKIQVVAIVQVPVLYGLRFNFNLDQVSFIQGGSMLFSFKAKFVYTSITHAIPLLHAVNFC